VTLRAALRVDGRLDVGVTAAAGEVVAVVGPNGAGKSTLLGALAGTVEATGSALLGDRELLDLPPERRRVGWVPQAGLLFPHLSAAGNVAYGLRTAGTGRARAHATAREWLDRFGVGHLADARPATLSGGEAARVALARALAADPRLLLLDEPMAALDAATRTDVRRLLRAALTGGSAATLLVTHDPVDAVAVADRVLVIESGRVVQDAAVAEVLTAPRSTWVAELIGLNAWRGTVRDGTVALAGGGTVVAADGGAPREVLALVPPSAVALHRAHPEGSPRNVLRGRVASSTFLAERVRVAIDSTPAVTAEVTVAAAGELGLGAGGEVWASFKATEVRLVDV
jgi:molybdate transport system permease protein